MYYKTIAVLIMLFLSHSLIAQIKTQKDFPEIVSTDWKERGITGGLNYSRYLYGEIGHYRSYVWEAGGFPALSTLMNYACEFTYVDKMILAPKIQARMHAYIFNTSLSTILYNDFQGAYSLKIRPEIGVGLWNFDINYGYNINIIEYELPQINTHMLTIRRYFNIKKKNLNEYDAKGNIIKR